MIFGNKTYNVLKFIALVLLPALGAFYFAVAGYWGLPYPKEVLGTISAVDVFLGVILGISSVNYYKKQSTEYDVSGEDVLPPSQTVTMRDVLKWVAQLLIPGLATLYFALSAIWNLPYPEQIVGTLTAFDAILGAILGISSEIYSKPLSLK
jgi:hypothetical protein